MQVSNNVTVMNMAQVLDRNKDGKLQAGQEIKMSPEQIAAIDKNKDQELSVDELTVAIEQDFVQIQYTTNKPALINLNPTKFRGSSDDKSRGIVYGGVLGGAGVGAGAGALIAMAFGAPASAGAPIGGLIGAVGGGIGSGIYASQQEVTTVFTPIDPKQEPDPVKQRNASLIGAGIGAAVGATAGFFAFSRTGLMSTGTGIFAGASAGATFGMLIGNGIGSSKPKD